MEQIRIITGNRGTIDETELMSPVSFLHTINPTKDFSIGNATSARIIFTVNRKKAQRDDRLIYEVWESGDTNWRQQGIFFVDTITEKDGIYTYVAYDSMSRMDISATSALDATGIIVIEDAVLSIIHNMNFNEDAASSYTNMPFYQNELPDMITAREVLALCAGCSGGNVWVRPDGTFYTGVFSNNTKVLSPSQYYNKSADDILIEAIDSVKTMTCEGISTYSNSSSDNSLLLANKFFVTATNHIATSPKRSTYKYWQSSILNSVMCIGQYYTMTINTYEDYGINVGDKLSVDGKVMYVMTKSKDKDGYTFSCTGNLHRNDLLTDSDRKVYEQQTVPIDYSIQVKDWLASNDNKSIGGTITANTIKADTYNGDFVIPNYTWSDGTQSYTDLHIKDFIDYVLTQLGSTHHETLTYTEYVASTSTRINTGYHYAIYNVHISPAGSATFIIDGNDLVITNVQSDCTVTITSAVSSRTEAVYSIYKVNNITPLSQAISFTGEKFAGGTFIIDDKYESGISITHARYSAVVTYLSIIDNADVKFTYITQNNQNTGTYGFTGLSKGVHTIKHKYNGSEETTVAKIYVY